MAIDPITNIPSQPVKSGAALDPTAIRRELQTGDKRTRAEAVANQLEGVFMEMMVKAMRATVQEDGLFGKSLGGGNYVEMLDQQYAKLAGIPRDPRFHEVLVNQIMKQPEETNRAMERMNQGNDRNRAAGAEGAMGVDGAMGNKLMP
jgi:Rod binding domain-containing protein